MTPDILIEALQGTVETQGDGTICYRNAQGQTHRTSGPAIIQPDGEEHWYQNGKRHRTDGPASVFPSGAERWFQNGVLHRLDGPAVVYCTKKWYQNGLLHRTDGAAVVFPNGDLHWFLNGERLSEEEFNRRITAGEFNDA